MNNSVTDAQPARSGRKRDAVLDAKWLRQFPPALLSVLQIIALSGLSEGQVRRFLRGREVELIKNGVGGDNSKQWVAPAELMEKVPWFWKTIEMRVRKLLADTERPTPVTPATPTEQYLLVLDPLRVVELRGLTSVDKDRVAFKTSTWIDPRPDPMRTYLVLGTAGAKHYFSHVVEARGPHSEGPAYTAHLADGRAAGAEC